ncbi:MAG: hypothetical protein A2068_06860 [Ignavibacteria bacterium GWB2_35_6b]|nr:MAG: hypothetical protein A2068_06860 [Ignavibacteria bacterium GWB2_35_6b]
MYYHDSGEGETTFIFLHGNPTSSYLWRNIIPYLEKYGRCIAPDLMGMGESDKLDETITGRYTYKSHYMYLKSLLSELQVEKNVVLIVHDWGGVLGINWARENKTKILGIALMETFLEPLETGKTPSFAINWFNNFHSDSMKTKVLEKNHFVETILIKNLSTLNEFDKEEYRKPYKNPGADRLPTLLWPREVPINDFPGYTAKAFIDNMDFMNNSAFPKLFINAEPGALLASQARKNVIRSWKNVTEVKVKGTHYIQEESPKDIGEVLSKWFETVFKK